MVCFQDDEDRRVATRAEWEKSRALIEVSEQDYIFCIYILFVAATVNKQCLAFPNVQFALYRSLLGRRRMSKLDC